MTIAEKLAHIERTIADTAGACQRLPKDILLLAVSKGQPISFIREAYCAGLTNFGENYLQEALAKIHALKDLAIDWHFIGPIQSNKATAISQNFSWVHSLSRREIAEKLAEHRPQELPALNICLQVNLDGELTKSGTSVQQLLELAQVVSCLPRLQLRGLMAIPQPLADEQEQYQSLHRLKLILDKLNRELKLSMDTLSIGMSDDMVAAIRAGSTILRIGRAIFGERR
ncbi:MAG: YggS family pyridoxal phosphate-dependent enzyme [Tatlockia sp.]|nr:YggS family pyridoxal phosphate-dependent enzyme [Tatlockia sp.]